MFAPELPGLDREAIRDWYNGYSWRGDERVYNPFDFLLLFRSREFGAHWFETGSPTFLVDTPFRRRVRSVDLDGMLPSDDLLSKFDVDAIAPEALLFQTGHLTILREEPRGGERFYRLGYPNREVQQGLNHSLLDRMVGEPDFLAPPVRLQRLLDGERRRRVRERRRPLPLLTICFLERRRTSALPEGGCPLNLEARTGHPPWVVRAGVPGKQLATFRWTVGIDAESRSGSPGRDCGARWRAEATGVRRPGRAVSSSGPRSTPDRPSGPAYSIAAISDTMLPGTGASRRRARSSAW